MQYLPAIAIEGPKGVGKTETALQRANSEWYFEISSQRELFLSIDIVDTIKKYRPILLDEWQKLPESWDIVRRLVDRGAPPGAFLITGSATPKKGSDTHSGAGRILSLRMRPMALFERGLVTPSVSLKALFSGTATIDGSTVFNTFDYFEAIEASGFPLIMNAPSDIRQDMVDSYITRIIEQDIPEHASTVRRPETLRRWLRAYAAASSTIANYSTLLDATTTGDGFQPAKSTTIAYRDHLSQIWVLDPLPGWSPVNRGLHRLQQAPKHHLADPALEARLMGLSAKRLATPSGSQHAGSLFESLATLSVRVAAQAARATVGHLRTRNGDHEIDLIAENAEGEIVAFEVKLAPEIKDSDVRQLLWLKQRLPEEVKDIVVLTTGTHAYRRKDGVAVIPLALLGT